MTKTISTKMMTMTRVESASTQPGQTLSVRLAALRLIGMGQPHWRRLYFSRANPDCVPVPGTAISEDDEHGMSTDEHEGKAKPITPSVFIPLSLSVFIRVFLCG